MKVIHTYPENGKSKILLEDSRFPNGPVSERDEDLIEFLEYNTEQMRLAALSMEANKDRQNLLLEREKQLTILNKLKRKIMDKMIREKNKIGIIK